MLNMLLSLKGQGPEVETSQGGFPRSNPTQQQKSTIEFISNDYNLDDSNIHQQELWTSRSLPRQKRKVKFEDEAPPTRPPPPAPERQKTSFQASFWSNSK